MFKLVFAVLLILHNVQVIVKHFSVFHTSKLAVLLLLCICRVGSLIISTIQYNLQGAVTWPCWVVFYFCFCLDVEFFDEELMPCLYRSCCCSCWDDLSLVSVVSNATGMKFRTIVFTVNTHRLTEFYFYRAKCRGARYCRDKLSVCPSVCPSVMLVDCDHMPWNSSKIISQMIRLGTWLSADPNITGLLLREHPIF